MVPLPESRTHADRDTMTGLLRVTDLHTHFQTDRGLVKAVKGLSFEIAKGEVVGMVGESGCGKSVSALSVMRLIRNPPGKIVGGSIVFQGTDLLSLSEADMRKVRGAKIAMIFQDPISSLNPVLTIGHQILEMLERHLGLAGRAGRTRAVELLSLVGIPDPRNRLEDYPHQFSGGMCQRVMIAMALSCEPKLLIADEPTTALDVTIQAQILDLMARLRRELDMAILLITHDMGVLAGVADRIVVMYAGYAVESGTVDDVFHSPRHPYTLGLLRCLPRIDGPIPARLPTITGMPPDMAAGVAGCPFQPRCPFAFDKCMTENPRLEAVAPTQQVACYADVRTGLMRE
jgi:oligopeptide transport system ATP-binding protein